MLKKQDKRWTKKPYPLLKRVAWVNIVAQIVFPVAGTVTPALARANTPPVSRAAPLPHVQTQPYRLAAGESVKTVAKRHGLTETELKKLNQLRTFSKSFSALGAGDEVDVPQSQSHKLLADSLRQAAAAETPVRDTESTLANAASRAAGMLKSGHLVDSAKNQLRGMAVSEANQTLQNWLQRYGTVKLQANVDDRGRLDGSQFDMLLPLYDTEKQMAFTQFGLRHIDSRTTANFGLGQRHFLADGMVGYNAFLDHDITRDHTRLGVGAEYARDFMKFGANGYFRASGWKDGKKLTDYEERPANGFDLRAEGYVPSYPQLGGKLIYEQYFGNQVGLLSEERRQKNPAAFTLGMNYTPIPLVTLGLDRRQSASGGGETRFNVGLNYEIGTPWSRQVDSDALAFKRSLQGGRYDLVERNNQIVLEYRKKNLIRLMMEARISGRGGAVIPLNISVSAKHGLKDIVWDTAGLVAGGGKLVSAGAPQQAASLAAEPGRGGTHYLLTLPPYHEKGHNTYTLSGIAYDTQGNASDRVDAQILVVSSAVNPAGSGFEPTHKAMVADGKTQTVIRLKLTDNNGKPVTGAADSITLTDDKSKLTGDGKDPALGTAVKEVPPGSGIYEITATAGTKHGKWKITPTVDGHELSPTVIDFGDSLANMIDTDKTEFKPATGTLNQAGDETDIILNLKDKDGNPITGAADKITLTDDKSDLYGQNPNPILTAIKEDPLGSGIYKAKVIAGKKKGTWKITPTVDGKALKPTTVTFGQSLTDIVDTQGLAFTPATNVLVANNEDSTVMTLHLKDKSGNPISNAKDSITFEDNGDQLTGDGKNPPTIDKVWEEPENSGIYKVKVKAGDKTGQWKVTTKIDGKPLDTPTEITFGTSRADLFDPDKSEFIPEKGELPHEGDTTVIRLNLKDINGQPITGVENSINLIPDNHELYGEGDMPTYGQAKEVPPNSGIYAVPVTAGAKKGKWTLTPEVFGKRLKRPAIINFGQTLADVLDINGSTVAPTDGSNALPADGVTTKTLRIELKDKEGKALIGAKDSIKVSASGELKGDGKDPQIAEVKEVADGVYEVIVTAGLKTGNWKLTTTVDGTEMNKGTVLEFDDNKAPSVNIAYLEGELGVNSTLRALYQFNTKDGNATDRSFYVWGDKGSTAKQVMALADAAGAKEPIELVQKNGEGRVAAGVADKDKVTYVIGSGDIGKVLEVSILAANDANLRAKAPETIDVNDPRNTNSIIGGNNQGGVSDPNAKPSIDKIVLSGDLELNKLLTATYIFNDNGGDATDHSQFVWHDKEIAPQDFQPIPDSSGILTKNLVQDDAGKTIAITVKPINGKKDTGELKTVDTGFTNPDINKTVSKGGKPGTILDPTAKPTIEGLMLEGKLYFEEVLTAKYTFNPNNGDITDKSEYVWTRFDLKDLNNNSRESVSDPDAKGTVNEKSILSGEIPSYKLSRPDSGKLLELAIVPKNKLGVEATDKIVINTNKDDTLIGGTEDGEVIDPSLGGEIVDLAILGKLEMGQQLTGSYRFVKHDKGDSDESVFLWGIKYPDSNDPNSPKSPEYTINDLLDDTKHHIKTSETVPAYRLRQEDSGQVIQLAMVPRGPRSSLGGKIRFGSVVKTDTQEQQTKGNVTGGNQDGTIKGIATDFSITSSKGEEEADGSKAIKAKKTDPDPIKLTISTTGADGKSVGSVPVTIKMTAMNRQKSSDTVTVKLVKDEGVLVGSGDTYSGHTDEKGNLVINVTDPNGIGTRTTLSVEVNEGTTAKTETRDVIFTVITSPNTDKANYWGHMEETVYDGSNTFYRPRLASEMNYNDLIRRNNEDWGTLKWSRARTYCQDTLNSGFPTIAEAKKLAGFNGSSHYLYTSYGWPVNTDNGKFWSWTSEFSPTTPERSNVAVVNLDSGEDGHSGSSNPDGGVDYYVVCRK
ncbi:inverse autotransporter beta domain-containing protein [Xenorhabdus littoralis]|uniref:inverse autotransporter beta domain-containing protein n=1 Tax=Xenorhabdus littoralis TaxID=2582835 RepID=UPI0029E7DA94|nr:inverse autotransporter beta domain-containing protein [Xenorhabdus sp. psl]MDX7989772.1 hypothetical protein [Xenorhabdus sp. psl]